MGLSWITSVTTTLAAQVGLLVRIAVASTSHISKLLPTLRTCGVALLPIDSSRIARKATHTAKRTHTVGTTNASAGLAPSATRRLIKTESVELCDVERQRLSDRGRASNARAWGRVDVGGHVRACVSLSRRLAGAGGGATQLH